MRRTSAMVGIGVWVVLLMSLAVLQRPESCGIQLVPFADIRQALRGASAGLDLQLRLVAANVAAFVPLGLLACGGWGRLHQPVLIGFSISAAIEVLQYALCRGATTTDDLLLNVAGTVVGLAAWTVASKLCLGSSGDGPRTRDGLAFGRDAGPH